MLLNVAAHNVSIQNIKVSKRECHITYRVTKHTYICNTYVMCTLHFVMVYNSNNTFRDTGFSALLLCATTFSNIRSCTVDVMLLYVM